jgi:hypothetical protein
MENALIFYKLIEAKKTRDLINGYILAENYKEKMYRYIVFKNKTDFEEAILKSGRLFEIIESDECRAYFDIDYKDTENIDFEEDLNCITNFLDKVFDISCNPLVFVRDDETVKSAHIYYDFFTNKETLKKITNVLKNKIECIDTSIYSKNRNFCLPNHTKFEYNSARRFVEYTFWETLERIKYNVSDFLCDIRHSVNEKIRIPKMTFGEIVENVNVNVDVDLNSENNNETISTESLGDSVDFNLDNLINFLPKKFYFHKFHFKLLVKYIIDNYDFIIPFLEHSKSIIKKEYSSEEIETYILNIRSVKLSTHGIVNLIRKYYNIHFYDYKLLEDFITFACDVMKTPESEYEEIRCKIKKSNLTLHKKDIIISNYIIKLDKFIILNPNCNTFYYFNTFVKNGNVKNVNENVKNVYIDDIINNENILSERLISVKALYGSGKTKRIVFHILEKLFTINLKCKVCFLTETNSLNTSITQKLKNYMCNLFPRILIGSHQDTPKKIEINYDIFVCSLESISKCNEIYDYLILDEYESLLFHFTSKTMSQMTNESMKFDKLINLMKSSKRCILLDADLTMSRVNIAKSIIGCDCSFYNCLDNNFKDYTYSVFYKRSEMFNKFKISCDNSKKIIFCSNSKKELERIYEERSNNFNGNTALLCSNKVVRIYYGNSKEEKVIPKIDFIADLDNNLQMLDVDILLFTPTITTGVSIEVEYFDVMYASGFNKNTAIARAFVQMLFRPRNLKDKDINICFIQPTSFNKCFFDITDFEKNIEYQSCLYDIKLKILNDNVNEINRKEIYDMMYNLNVIEKEMSQFYFTQYVCSLLMSHNLNVNYVFKDEQKEYDTAMYKYILDQKCVEDLRSADLITETDKEIIEENNKMSGFDKLDWDKIQRYNLTNFHPNVIIRDSIITNWNGNNDNIKCLIELKERINSSKNKLFYENYETGSYNEIDCLTQFNERLIEREISDYIYNLLGLTRSNNYELKIKIEDFDKIISNLTEEDISKLNKYHQVLINDKTNASPFKVKLEKNNLNHLKDILNKLNIQMTNHVIVYEYKNDPRDLLKPEMLRLRTYNTDKKEKNKIYRKECFYYYLAIKNNLYFKINENVNVNECVVRTFHSNYNKITKKNDNNNYIYKITELEDQLSRLKSYKVDELNCDGYKMETFKKSKDFYTAKHPLQNNGEKYYPKVYKQQTLNKNKVATFVKTSEKLSITEIPNTPEVYKKKRYIIKPIGVYEPIGEIVYHTTNKIEQKNENKDFNETDLKTNLHNELTNPDTLMRVFKYDLTSYLKNDTSRCVIETEKIVYVPEESVDYHDE